MTIKIEVVYENIPAAGRPHAVQSVDKRRFARPRRPEKPDKLVRLDRQRDRVEERNPAAAESAFYFAREIDGIDSCFRTRIENAYISRVIDAKNERPDLYGVGRRHRLTRNTPPVDINAIGRAKIVDDDLAA